MSITLKQAWAAAKLNDDIVDRAEAIEILREVGATTRAEMKDIMVQETLAETTAKQGIETARVALVKVDVLYVVALCWTGNSAACLDVTSAQHDWRAALSQGHSDVRAARKNEASASFLSQHIDYQ